MTLVDTSLKCVAPSRAAKAIGLTIPSSVLTRADELIQ